MNNESGHGRNKKGMVWVAYRSGNGEKRLNPFPTRNQYHDRPYAMCPARGVSDEEKTHSGTTDITRRPGRGKLMKFNFRTATAQAAAAKGYEDFCSTLAEELKPNEIYKPERLTAGL